MRTPRFCPRPGSTAVHDPQRFALLFSVKTSVQYAVPLIAAFGLFHGNAHGSEIAQDISALHYAIGFALATSLLHGAGVAFVLVLEKYFKPSQTALAVRAFGSLTLASAALLLWV